jgi:hypothetical protein
MRTIAERLVYARQQQAYPGTRDFYLASKDQLDRAGISEELMLVFESGTTAPTWDQALALSRPYGVMAKWIHTGQLPMYP